MAEAHAAGAPAGRGPPGEATWVPTQPQGVAGPRGQRWELLAWPDPPGGSSVSGAGGAGGLGWHRSEAASVGMEPPAPASPLHPASSWTLAEMGQKVAGKDGQRQKQSRKGASRFPNPTQDSDVAFKVLCSHDCRRPLPSAPVAPTLAPGHRTSLCQLHAAAGTKASAGGGVEEVPCLSMGKRPRTQGRTKTGGQGRGAQDGGLRVGGKSAAAI